MRPSILLAILAPSIAVAAPSSGKTCSSGIEKTDRDPAERLTARPLTREPSAAQLLAVYRSIDGCPQPVVLRDGLGKEGRDQPAPRSEPRRRPLR